MQTINFKEIYQRR